MAYRKTEKYMTPFGVVRGFAAIVKPSTKFDDNGVYSFNLEFSGADAKEMKTKIDGWMKKSMKEAEATRSANPPYEVNKENKTLTVKFKLKAVIKTRKGDWERSIDLYGPKGGKVRIPKKYAEGTELRVNCEPYMWNVPSMGAGITIQPLAVQFRKVVEWTPDAVDPDEHVFEDISEQCAADGQREPLEPQEDDDFADDDTDTDDGDDFDF